MALIPITPRAGWRGTANLFNQFDDFFNEFERGLYPATGQGAFDFTPPMDLEEDDTSYLVSMDLPGMKKSEIKIDCADKVLTISGERTRDVKAESKYTERPCGSFQRTFTLPSHVEVNNIRALFEDGVLKVTLPKTEAAKSRMIKIS